MRCVLCFVERLVSCFSSFCIMVVSEKRFPANFVTDAIINGEVKRLVLSELNGQYSLLYFYPMDFCLEFQTELIAFSERIAEFHNVNCEVVACSVDNVFCHFAWQQRDVPSGGIDQLRYPHLSDISRQISRSFGLLNEDVGVAVRSLVILDEAGSVQQIVRDIPPHCPIVDEALSYVIHFQQSNAREKGQIDLRKRKGDILMNPQTKKLH
eukprot:GCRY01004196.1.p1 GENE.GCRY01004196.1~~GCRY01004196.1.p1  ORF type:complete len:210 (+),score=6.11 GCRY01004196.1:24-653(+)